MRKYPSLRPYDRGDAPEPERQALQTLLPKRRRIGVSVACDSCRQKKIRCDGQRPNCSACESKDAECSYRDLSRLSPESRSLLLEVIHLLNGLPQEEQSSVVRILKNEDDASVILSTLRGGMDSKERPSDHATAMAIMDSSFQAIELESQNPNAYLFLPPLHAETLQGASYRRLITSGATLGAASPQRSEYGVAGSTITCDDRLHFLNIRHWTPVPIPNGVAARAISLYLETDHPLLGNFDPDLFLADLTSAKTDYCSSVLVNALLYWACQMYSALDTTVDDLALCFCTEAERLWDTEKNNDSVLNLAAAQLLSMGYLGQGRNHVVLSYLRQASDMAVRMGLFGGDEDDRAAARMQKLTSEAVSAHLHAAWGTFNWITLMSLFYRQPGMHCSYHPPCVPIPGEESMDTAPSSPASTQASQRDNMKSLFPHLCRFWRIMHEVSLAYEEQKHPPGFKGTLAFAEFKFRELLAWSNRLPRHLSRDDQHPHYVQVLHLWFHTAILDIFRPWIDGSPGQSRLRTFTSIVSSPIVVYAASINQLKQLIVNYRLNFVASTYTILWHSALIYLSNAILQLPREENWLFYFLVCVYSYERLRRPWRVTRAIGTALLSLAMRNGSLSSDRARAILRDLDRDDFTGIHVLGKIRATFMSDLDMARCDPGQATVEKQAGEFEQYALLEEFTNEFGDEDA
ncbi:hypothetical protein XA68_16977 [Ophiocordyceps unilateralis]|uniref:Zn(2)-C6 fungal-type domain-containing protein n=1 Tax=Ophiocordyceps unilateralis TaxID=268505 RepID=A0A2A9PJZ9_OPHUN|nr:hypothetical protein XA68_16977 [Ophiocordyceps unilateralis]